MPSVSGSASLSLATPTMCAILLMLVRTRLFANEVDYYRLFKMRRDCSQTRWIITNFSKCSGRTIIGDHVDVFFTFFGPDLEEKEEDAKRSILAFAQAIFVGMVLVLFVYGGHVPHALFTYVCVYVCL